MNSVHLITKMIIFAVHRQPSILDRPSYGPWTMLELKTGDIIPCQVFVKQRCSLHKDNPGNRNINNVLNSARDRRLKTCLQVI